jgi:hypothetical protein
MRLKLLFVVCAVAWSMTQMRALDPSWASGAYCWNQGQNHKRLNSVSTHMCVLARVSGDFDGGGEEVKLYQYDGYWYIGGKSMQSGVGGCAYCFAKNQFLANGTARWSSDDGIWKSVSTGSGCYGAQGDAWWGDATTMLNGISGRLRGSGDRALVTQSYGPFTPSILRVEACKGGSSGIGFIRAYAHSFFAGTPSSGGLAKYWGSEFLADSALHCTSPGSLSGYGDHEVPMAPVNDAMCHFTSIGGGGNWDGGGEFVQIYPKYVGGIERWYLRAFSGYCGNDRRTIARARCYKRDQR